MRRFPVLFVALGLASVAALAAAPAYRLGAQADGTPASGTEGVPVVVRAWIDAWNSDDPAGNVAALYADNAVYEDVPSNSIATGDEIEGFLAGFFGG